MIRKANLYRWLMLVASGAFMLQATGCDFLQIVQTSLLGTIAGVTIFLATQV